MDEIEIIRREREWAVKIIDLCENSSAQNIAEKPFA